jgi:hypothetical protein
VRNHEETQPGKRANQAPILHLAKVAKGQSETTLDAAAKAISRFEEHTRYRNLKAFHFQQAVAFKAHLAGQSGQRSGEKLSKATLHATLTQ